MAGTLTISTLSDGTNSTSATNCIQGSAKAWVNFNGVTTATVRASYNVSSVTRNGTGDYTINFTNALVDGNYCPTISTISVSNTDTTRTAMVLGTVGTGPTLQSTTQLRVGYGWTGSTTMQDTAQLCVGVFR